MSGMCIRSPIHTPLFALASAASLPSTPSWPFTHISALRRSIICLTNLSSIQDRGIWCTSPCSFCMAPFPCQRHSILRCTTPPSDYPAEWLPRRVTTPPSDYPAEWLPRSPAWLSPCHFCRSLVCVGDSSGHRQPSGRIPIPHPLANNGPCCFSRHRPSSRRKFDVQDQKQVALTWARFMSWKPTWTVVLFFFFKESLIAFTLSRVWR